MQSAAVNMRALALSALLALGACTKDDESEPASTEHSVVVHFNYGNKDWDPFFAWEEKFEAAIAASGAGEYDGNELAVDGSDGTLFLYGPDADKLFAVAKPQLETATLLKNVEATLRYGDVSDETPKEVTLKVTPVH